METKDPKSTETTDTDRNPESKDPQSDATSSETLSDVEETEKVPAANEAGAEEGERSPVPSPDGAFDEGRGSGNELEDAGPM